MYLERAGAGHHDQPLVRDQLARAGAGSGTRPTPVGRRAGHSATDTASRDAAMTTSAISASESH